MKNINYAFDLLYLKYLFFSSRNVKLDQTYFDRNIEQSFMAASKDLYQQKTLPYLFLANQVGNMYTPSLYGGLAAFVGRLASIIHFSTSLD